MDAFTKSVRAGKERKMKTVLWIIAICEVIRAVQNMLQLWVLKRDTGARDNAYAEFVKSLKQTDKEFVRKMLDEFERSEDVPV